MFSGLGGKPSAEAASKNVFGSTNFGAQSQQQQQQQQQQQGTSGKDSFVGDIDLIGLITALDQDDP